jgi:tol-pal system protein YbgF
MRKYNKMQAVILFMTALLLFSGCAMKRDIVEVEEKIDVIRTDQQQMKGTLARLDSLLNSEAAASLQFRAEIKSSMNDLVEQFQAVQANTNDLQDKVSFLAQNQGGRQTIPAIRPQTDTGAAPGVTEAPEIDCQKLYDDSFINIRRSQYEDAIKGFNDYLKYCGSKELAANARYWIGESYYSMEKYKEAIDQFNTLLRDYSKSEKRPGALYKIGRSYEEMGQKKEARVSYKKLTDEYPGTLEASQAKEKLKELK